MLIVVNDFAGLVVTQIQVYEQSINQSLNKSINQSINISINQSMNKHINDSVNHAITNGENQMQFLLKGADPIQWWRLPSFGLVFSIVISYRIFAII